MIGELHMIAADIEKFGDRYLELRSRLANQDLTIAAQINRERDMAAQIAGLIHRIDQIHAEAVTAAKDLIETGTCSLDEIIGLSVGYGPKGSTSVVEG